MLLPAVSLFSNCGAGDFGYKQAGFEFSVMAEIQQKRLRVAGRNHRFADLVVGDLRETWPVVVDHYRTRCGKQELALLCACPPCQGMSSLNSHRGNAKDMLAGARDKRNLLVLPIIEVAKALNPQVIVVENVAAFLTRKIPHPVNHVGISAANLLLKMLEPNYLAFSFLGDLAHYGVPQQRVRTFLTLIRRDVSGAKRLVTQRRAPYPRPSHDPSQGGNFPLAVGPYLRSLQLPSLDARSATTSTSDISPLHRVPVWKQHHIDMVDAIPPGSGKSAWDNCACIGCGPVDVNPEATCCPCCHRPLLRPVVKKPVGGFRLVKGFRSTSYRRMDPNKPAPTITTASGTIGSARTIHPTETRVLSPLECGYLQTIPTDFEWTDGTNCKIEHHFIRRMIGEAVPPKFTEMHGQAILGVLTDQWPFPLISIYDHRCSVAQKRLGQTLEVNGSSNF